MIRLQTISSLCIALLLGSSASAEEVVELQGTSVIGNRELPKVLYIVPWKGSELPQLGDAPMGNLIDDALAPIEREEHRRQIDLFNTASTPK